MPLVSKYDAKIKNIRKISMLSFYSFRPEPGSLEKGKFLPDFLTTQMLVTGANSLHIQVVALNGSGGGQGEQRLSQFKETGNTA